ncbi:MAG: GatB/YqeY domain-containing protein [Propionibacteriaceae bacterium]|jgi:uncharacterized protein YqeY|nr:GatB/YqeY domain-containing protein [Propionibacteriaceae bacterium]
MSEQQYFAKAEPFNPSGGAAEAMVAGVGVLTARLKADLTAALKARDDAAKSSLRMALAALQNAEVAGTQAKTLTEAEELAVLTKEVRKREDAAETYRAAGRTELADKETAEAKFLSQYLPRSLTEAELSELVDAEVAKVAAELGEAPTMKHMGAIVKAVNANAVGRADGGKVASLVRAKLG